MLIPRKSQQGATLIELVIGVTIVAMVFLMAQGTLMAWIVNTQIRNGAEALQNGLQVARNEAIRSNRNVEFRLGAGTGWTVVGVTADDLVQGRSEEEGSRNVTVTVLPAGATKLTYTALGRVATKNADNTDPITRLNVSVPTSVLGADEAKDLSIMTDMSRIWMCNPKVTDAADSRHC